MSGRRIVLIDALRGVCFVFMTVDHLPGSPISRFSNPVSGPFGFFTAALGFIFLSGVVCGLVYEEVRIRDGSRAMTRRVARRLRGLYFTQILMLAVLLSAVTASLPGVSGWGLGRLQSDPWEGLFLGASMLYEPGYLGILPMYILFLLLTPALICQFARGHVWHVLCASAAVWILSGLMLRLPNGPYDADLGALNPFGHLNPFGYFNPLGVQFVFITGLALGTARVRIDQISRGIQRWLLAASVVIAATFFVLRQEYAVLGPSVPGIGPLGNAIQFGPLRVVDFAAFSVVVYWAARRIQWANVNAVAFRWLAFVGRNSLPVFAWSILVAYAAKAALPVQSQLVFRIAALAVATISLTLPAQLRATYIGWRGSRSRRLALQTNLPETVGQGGLGTLTLTYMRATPPVEKVGKNLVGE